MSAPLILIRIFNLKLQQDLAPPEDCEYIQKQIDEQINTLQCIVKEPMSSITQIINKQYPKWLDGQFPELQSDQEKQGGV
jgi:hypothetical protein